MKLEHRWSQRKRVYLNAIVFYRPLGLLRAKVLDVSLEGAFVDTGRIDLPAHALVELTFTLETEGRQRVYQMEAIVVHHQRTGSGLMFKDFKLDAFQAIRDILYAA